MTSSEGLRGISIHCKTSPKHWFLTTRGGGILLRYGAFRSISIHSKVCSDPLRNTSFVGFGVGTPKMLRSWAFVVLVSIEKPLQNTPFCTFGQTCLQILVCWKIYWIFSILVSGGKFGKKVQNAQELSLRGISIHRKTSPKHHIWGLFAQNYVQRTICWKSNRFSVGAVSGGHTCVHILL